MTESMITRLARAVANAEQHADPNDAANRRELDMWAGIAQPTDEDEIEADLAEQDEATARRVQERIAHQQD